MAENATVGPQKKFCRYLLRPLLCGSVFRRCFASLAAASITDECAAYFTSTFPNFLQCAGGLKDGQYSNIGSR